MSEAKDDLEIVIDPPEGAEAAVVVEPKEAKANPAAVVVKPEEGLEALRQKLELERAGRVEAEKRERVATERATSATAEVQDTNLALVSNAIETVKSRQEALLAKHREARTNGDYDAEMAANSGLQRAEAELLQLEQGKQALEQQAKKPAPRELPGDPVEALAMQLSPRSASWVRAHPEFARDPTKYQRMLAAHNLAVTDGIAADSDEYFENIEATLKVGSRAAAPEVGPDDDALSGAATGHRRAAAPAAAPPSHSGTANGERRNIVRLTAAEVEAAADSGLTPEEYAKNKATLQREGRMH